MDYSLLIGIHSTERVKSTTTPESTSPQLHSVFQKEFGGFRSTDFDNRPLNEIYYLGIIDVLTSYSTLKKFEHAIKSIRYGSSQISSINPKQYAERFINFILSDVLLDSKNIDYERRNLPTIPEVKESDEKGVINIST